MINISGKPALAQRTRSPIHTLRRLRSRGLLELARLLLVTLLPIGPLLIAVGAHAQTVSAVPSLDLQRYLGTWHELAHYPNKPEKACVSDAVALYTARYKPRQFALVTSCQTGSGPSDAGNVNGKMDKAGDGKLTVTHFWPFTQKRWVLALGPAYEWALVGSPNHKSLWILSRTPTLKPEVLADIKSRAAAQGFDPARMITLPRS